MSIAKLTIRCGGLLIVVGVVGTLTAMSMVDKWWYASIPALVGALLVICSWAISKGNSCRTIAMYLAPTIALVGVVGSFMPSGLDFSRPGSVAFVSSIFRLLTILIAGGFVLLWLRSWIAARQPREG